jgi:6-pyruvoyl-tetrahydropterin synthase
VHGATFVVAVTYMADELDKNGIVVDIGRANDLLKETLAPINYKNLDDLPEFKGKNTTTEFLTKYVFDKVALAVRNNKLGRNGKEIFALRVTVSESPTARAWYQAPLW